MDHDVRDKYQFAITALRFHRFCSSFIPVAVTHPQKMGRGLHGLQLQDTAHYYRNKKTRGKGFPIAGSHIHLCYLLACLLSWRSLLLYSVRSSHKTVSPALRIVAELPAGLVPES